MERRGIVRIREEMNVELPWHRFRASWQPDPNASADTFYSEDGPGWNDVEEAITWGRRHAPVVYVLIGTGRRDMFNAGERDDDARHPTRRWPGAPRRRAGQRHPDYGGAVWVDEEQLSLIPAGRFTANWETDSGEWVESRDDFTDVESAIEWGRERASIVLVAELPSQWSSVVPSYVIRSAGEADPPGERLERLRPRTGRETMEWLFASKRSATVLDPEEFGRKLQGALESDPDVTDPTCAVGDDGIGGGVAWSLPALVRSDDAPDQPLPQEPAFPQRWVDVSFRVLAPTRKRAFEAGLTALNRAVQASGESSYAWTGSIDVRSVE